MSPVSTGVPMIEWFGLERTFKDHLIQPPYMQGQSSTGWGCSKCHPTWPGTLRDGASLASLSNLFLCLATCTVKKCLKPNVNLFQFKGTASCPVTTGLTNKSHCVIFCNPLSYFERLQYGLPSLLFSRQSNSQLFAFLHRREVFKASVILVTLFCACFNGPISVLYRGPQS